VRRHSNTQRPSGCTGGFALIGGCFPTRPRAYSEPPRARGSQSAGGLRASSPPRPTSTGSLCARRGRPVWGAQTRFRSANRVTWRSGRLTDRVCAPQGQSSSFRQVCAKLHIRNAEPVALTASDLAVEPPASSSSMNRVSAFLLSQPVGGNRLRGAACFLRGVHHGNSGSL
jgi:hypothetical protein